MIIHRKFNELPLSCIEPQGWLRRYLETQRDGLTGHLEMAGYPFNTRGWGAARIAQPRKRLFWAPYEQYGYWVDGMARCGHLLGDPFLIGKAKKQIDYVLQHADADGYLGPGIIKPRGNHHRWPHAIFFRALIAHCSATNDKRIPAALRRHYLAERTPHFEHRDVCNVETMLWAYEQTGDKRLLRHAEKTYRMYNERIHTESKDAEEKALAAGGDTTVDGMLAGGPGYSHGVVYNEICKLGAILYSYTGSRRHLRATVNAFRKIDRHHMLIGGVCSSTERLRGCGALDGCETCVIADYTWSVGHLLQITGRAEYADRIERACFNAAPGAVTGDFKALQYFSGSNQVLADRHSNHTPYRTGNSRMSYRPYQDAMCCPGEVHRIMPNYAARMWLDDGAGGLVAALYGPCRITAEVGDRRQPVTIVQETQYPFGERIDLSIRTIKPVRFALTLRIPGWCRHAQVLVNGRRHAAKLGPASFVRVTQTFEHNDRITLILPMRLKLTRWPGGGIGIERGPLVYALRIEEQWRVDRRDSRVQEFPAWSIYPAGPWNYALDLGVKDLEDKVRVVHRPYTFEPWSITGTPIELHVPARRVRGWKTVKRRRITSQVGSLAKKITFTGDFTLTPPLPDPRGLEKRLGKKVETVTLVPFGCTNLRLAIFPSAKPMPRRRAGSATRG